MFIIIKKSRLYLVVIFTVMIAILFAISYATSIKSSNPISSTVKKEPAYWIFIEIEYKTLLLFNGDKCIKQYPIASGMPGWPSPIGEWKIISKSDWGEGFGGRWMGLNVVWGDYGIHGTSNPYSIGQSASHGCIRMFNKDVQELYDIVPIGTKVIIKNGPLGPFGTGFRELIPGDRGADVLAVQRRLKELGYFRGYESGIYGDDLKYAVYKFQKSKKLWVKFTITISDYLAMGFNELD